MKYHSEIYSAHFENFRSIAVYLPPGYDSGSERYPVLYALDGNNLFDVKTSAYGKIWELDKHLDRLITERRVPPIIAVGIYNTKKRSQEMLFGDGSWSKGFRIHGQADEFANFIVGNIKPLIDGTYRTMEHRESTFLMGSSFGGIFTLYASWQLAQFFSRFAVMSPALTWADHASFKLFNNPWPIKPRKVWLDMGDREGWDDKAIEFRNGVQEIDQLYDLCVKAGLRPGEEIEKFIHRGGVHSETSWSERLERVLTFLLSG